MAAITWKNVAAPNLAPITKVYGDAYANLGDSIADIGSAIEGYTTKRQDGINDKISSDIGSQLASATNQDELTQAINSFRDSGFEGNPDAINAAIGNASQNIAERENNSFNRNMQTSEFNNTVAQQSILNNHNKNILKFKQDTRNDLVKKQEWTTAAESAVAKSLNVDGTINKEKLREFSTGIPSNYINIEVTNHEGPSTGIAAARALSITDRTERIARNKTIADRLRSYVTGDELVALDKILGTLPDDADTQKYYAVSGAIEEAYDFTGGDTFKVKTGNDLTESMGAAHNSYNNASFSTNDNTNPITVNQVVEDPTKVSGANTIGQGQSAESGTDPDDLVKTLEAKVNEEEVTVEQNSKVPMPPLMSPEEYALLSTADKQEYIQSRNRETNRRNNAETAAIFQAFLEAKGNPRNRKHLQRNIK